MHITAIVCEYNPLHSGHAYQISRTRESADKVVCIMSGSWVQRGEPAFFDKWVRAKWALQAGADMVVELPVIFSLRSAQYFAEGAIRLAHDVGADSFCFGAEDDDLRQLQAIAGLHAHKHERSGEYKLLLQQRLADGLSYPAAQEAATAEILGLGKDVFQPNNILGIEYIKAAMKINSHMDPLPIKRMGSINSSACRQAILADRPVELPGYVQADIAERAHVALDDMAPMLLYALRMMGKEDFAGLPDVSEGLENRIFTASRRQTTLDGLLRDIAVKRYPLARVKRILCLALLGVCAEDITQYSRAPYARILGMREDAGDIVKHMQSLGRLQVATNTTDLAHPLFAMERRATDIRALAESLPAGLDYTQPFIRYSG